MKTLTFTFVFLAFAATAVCQGDPPASQAPTSQSGAAAQNAAAKAPFVFEAGEVPLRTLIERCAAYLQYNILVGDIELMAVPSGRGNAPRARVARRAQAPAAAPAEPDEEPEVLGPLVTLQLPVVTDREGCEELLTGLLWSSGLALVSIDEEKAVYEVLAMNGQRGREIPMRAVHRTPEQVLARPTLRHIVITVYALEHCNAMMATNALRPFFAQDNGSGQGASQLTIGNMGNRTSIVMTGPQDLVASALRVVQAADMPSPPEPQPELEARIEALAKQNEMLLKRLEVLEQKLDKR